MELLFGMWIGGFLVGFGLRGILADLAAVKGQRGA